MNYTPDISVLLPVCNADKYIGQAIESILSQTFSNFDIIAIDDGSKDHSLDILRQYRDPRLKVFTQENKGLAATLNTASRHASGRYLARMDADDICMPERFARQVAFLEANPTVSVLGTAVEYIDAHGNYVARSFPPLPHRVIARKISNAGCCIAHPSIMMRADSFRETGGYDERMRYHLEDLLLWAKMAALGHHIKNLPTPLIKYRLYDDAISNIFTDSEYLNLQKLICCNPLDLDDHLAAQFCEKHLALKRIVKKTAEERVHSAIHAKPFRLYQTLLKCGLPANAAAECVYLLRHAVGI